MTTKEFVIEHLLLHDNHKVQSNQLNMTHQFSCHTVSYVLVWCHNLVVVGILASLDHLTTLEEKLHQIYISIVGYNNYLQPTLNPDTLQCCSLDLMCVTISLKKLMWAGVGDNYILQSYLCS